jgi:hypothetical protein
MITPEDTGDAERPASEKRSRKTKTPHRGAERRRKGTALKEPGGSGFDGLVRESNAANLANLQQEVLLIEDQLAIRTVQDSGRSVTTHRVILKNSHKILGLLPNSPAAPGAFTINKAWP